MYEFLNNGKECWLGTHKPPSPFLNVLYNSNYFTIIDQHMFGKGSHMVDEGYVLEIVNKERIIYIRDDETGEYWAANWNPIFDQEPEAYRCGSGLGYQIIENVKNGIKCTWRIFVPAGADPLEIWDCRIENISGRPRRISTFTFNIMFMNGTDLYGGALYRFAEFKDELNGIFVLQDAQRHEDIDFPFHNAYFVTDRQPDSWDANLEFLLGDPWHTIANPKCVVEGICEKNTAPLWSPCGTLHFKYEIPPDGKEDFRVLVGACDREPMVKKMLDKYLKGNLDNCVMFDALTAERTAMTSNNHLETPEKSINIMLNTWVKEQIHFGATWCRWGYKGYRDIVQQAQGVCSYDPQLSRKQLKRAFEHQYGDGFALRGWHPLDPMRYVDSAQWTISATTEYIKETGDFAFLDEVIAFLDEGDAGVYEHMMRAMNRLHEDRGPHNMCLAFFGDWNDSLTGVCKDGKGESVWMSQAFCRCALLMQELAEYLNKKEDAELMAAWHKEMKDAINTSAWDGNWYLCALDDHGEAIGSVQNEYGKIYLNMQSWAQLGKVCDAEKWEKSFANVEKYLNPGIGLVLNWPAYRKPQSNVGRLSYCRPGVAENGSIYTHGNAFMLLALLERGMADRALQCWREIIPENSQRTEFTPQPNVFYNGYNGPEMEYRPGAPCFSWITGSAVWMLQAVIENMLGVRRTYNGLMIQPCFPSSWPVAKISRTYRGTNYNIIIKNPSGTENPPVREIKIDGKFHPVDQSLPMDDNDHQVEVILGESKK